MADQKNVTNNEAAQEVTPAAETTKEQVTAPETTETSAEPAQPEKEKKEHPKWDAFKAKAKKVGKWVGLGAAVVGGLFVANKIGQAQGQAAGFDQACDAFARGMNPDPAQPALPQNDDVIGVDDVVDADFAEIDVTPDPVIDTPAE